jgi:UDP-N-acetylglucosamine acyltransferase
MIHPTAVIDPNAQLDLDVRIGPYVVIEGPVEVRSGTEIQSHAVISGQVYIGKNNSIGNGAIIGSFPQDLRFDPRAISGVRIGDNNVIREYSTIHRGAKEGSNTSLGTNNLLMVEAHLGHDSTVGNNVILANNTSLGGYAEIHDRVFIGGGSVIHQFTRIGAVSLLQGCSAVSKDIPPFTISAGKNSVSALNIIGLRRAGFTASQRQEAKEAFKLLYCSGLNTRQALETANQRSWSPEIRPFWDFVRSSKRGICSLLPWREVKRGAMTSEET